MGIFWFYIQVVSLEDIILLSLLKNGKGCKYCNSGKIPEKQKGKS